MYTIFLKVRINKMHNYGCVVTSIGYLHVPCM